MRYKFTITSWELNTQQTEFTVKFIVACLDSEYLEKHTITVPYSNDDAPLFKEKVRLLMVVQFMSSLRLTAAKGVLSDFTFVEEL